VSPLRMSMGRLIRRAPARKESDRGRCGLVQNRWLMYSRRDRG
jgi:hypothetical protein